MNFGVYSYLITTLLFAGAAVAVEWLLGYKKLKRYWRIIGLGVLLVLLTTAIAEPIALEWHIWRYSLDKTLGISLLGAALETYVYTILVGIAITSATIAWAEMEEKGQPLIQGTLNEISDKL